MLTTKVFEDSTAYMFSVTDGTEDNTFEYKWGKTPPEGQNLTTYLKNCKREAELLAQLEINKKAPLQEIQL